MSAQSNIVLQLWKCRNEEGKLVLNTQFYYSYCSGRVLSGAGVYSHDRVSWGPWNFLGLQPARYVISRQNGKCIHPHQSDYLPIQPEEHSAVAQYHTTTINLFILMLESIASFRTQLLYHFKTRLLVKIVDMGLRTLHPPYQSYEVQLHPPLHPWLAQCHSQ